MDVEKTTTIVVPGEKVAEILLRELGIPAGATITSDEECCFGAAFNPVYGVRVTWTVTEPFDPPQWTPEELERVKRGQPPIEFNRIRKPEHLRPDGVVPLDGYGRPGDLKEVIDGARRLEDRTRMAERLGFSPHSFTSWPTDIDRLLKIGREEGDAAVTREIAKLKGELYGR